MKKSLDIWEDNFFYQYNSKRPGIDSESSPSIATRFSAITQAAIDVS